MNPEQLALYQKMAAIMRTIDRVYRDKQIDTKNGSYKVTTYDSMLDVVRPKLLENNIIIVRTSAKSILSGNICVVDAEYDIIDTTTGASIHAASIGAGHDLSDKHAGKALTYNLKYLLRDCFLLSSTDDPDYVSSDKNAESDLKSKLSNEYLCSLVNTAIAAGKITAADSEGLKQAIFLCGDNKAELEKARDYLKSNLGV
jgi:hypothetical protein